MKNENPLISCICITSNRSVLVQRAIACFERQDYPNKELVISYPEKDLLTKSVMDQIEKLSGIEMVRIERPEDEKLGIARNNAIQAANGEYICIWDDDDWYNDDRISQQFIVLKDGPFRASVLMNVLLYDSESKETYYSYNQDWEGTLLCEKRLLSETRYLDMDQKEHYLILPYLSSRNVLYHIIEMPHLYVYIFHGSNTMGEGYFNYYFLQSQLIDDHNNQKLQKAISLDYYSLRGMV